MAKAKKEDAPNTDEDSVVWAHTPLKELNMQTGFVTCSMSLATKLIKDKKVQHMDEGALNFKEIGSAPVAKELKKEQTKDIKQKDKNSKSK